MDYADAPAGPAHGQGSATSFDSTVLSKDVFGILDNTEDAIFAAAGQLVAAGTAVATFNATFTGEGDDDELGIVMATGTPGGVAGNYSFSSTVLGYGSMTDVTGLGSIPQARAVCMRRIQNSTFWISTPRRPAWEPPLSSTSMIRPGHGYLVPQGTIASDGSDLNNSYGFAAQAYTGNTDGSWPTGNPGWEYDFVGQGTFASLVFTTGTAGPNSGRSQRSVRVFRFGHAG